MDGVLLVDKPKTWTAHDVCAFVKGRFSLKKVGHAGTLDPNATGVLVVLLNAATKQSATLINDRKAYEGVFRLGVRTTSYDCEGAIVEENSLDGIDEELIRSCAAQFSGDMMQMPPMVSAIKKNGKKLYQLARKGKVVERDPRPVVIYQFLINSIRLPDVSFFVDVSKGFYVRSLAEDLGQQLGCGALLQELRRVSSGAFHVDDCITIDEIRAMKTADDLLPHVKRIVT